MANSACQHKITGNKQTASLVDRFGPHINDANSPANFVSGQAPASVSCMFKTVVGGRKNLFRFSPLQLVSIKCHKTPRAI